MYQIPTELQSRLLAARLDFKNLSKTDLFFIKFKMQGHYQRFHEYLQKHYNEIGIEIITLLYREKWPEYTYFWGLSKENTPFYLQIFQDQLIFNIGPTGSIHPLTKTYEFLRNTMDTKATLWIGLQLVEGTPDDHT